MTLFPPPANERGGSIRPSRSTPRAVVIALDPAVRDGWARALEAMGMETARCVGPTDRHRADGDHEPALSHVIAPPGG